MPKEIVPNPTPLPPPKGLIAEPAEEAQSGGVLAETITDSLE